MVPSLSAEQLYSDNIALSPSATAASDWVTVISPRITVSGVGDRLRLNGSYAPQGVIRARSSQNDVNHLLAFGANLEAVDDFLFIDATASASQQNISSRGGGPADNTTINGNRATVTTWSIQPSIRRRIGDSFATLNIGYRPSGFLTNRDDAISDSVGHTVTLGLASGPAFKLTTWSINGSWDNVNNRTTSDSDRMRVTARARRLLTPQFGLVGEVGYEDYDYTNPLSQPNGESWEAGFDWRPTTRTNLTATAGDRFFGKTGTLDFNHRTRLTTWKLTYADRVTDTRSEFIVPSGDDTLSTLDRLFLREFPDDQARRRAVENFIRVTGLPPSLQNPVNFFTNEVFLSRRWGGSFGILGARHAIIANLYRDKREALSFGPPVPGQGDFSINNTVNQVGGSVNWNWRLTGTSAANLGFYQNTSKYPGTGLQDDSFGYYATLTRQFHPKVTGALRFRHQENDSKTPGAGYDENSLSATLNMTF